MVEVVSSVVCATGGSLHSGRTLVERARAAGRPPCVRCAGREKIQDKDIFSYSLNLSSRHEKTGERTVITHHGAFAFPCCSHEVACMCFKPSAKMTRSASAARTPDERGTRRPSDHARARGETRLRAWRRVGLRRRLLGTCGGRSQGFATEALRPASNVCVPAGVIPVETRSRVARARFRGIISANARAVSSPIALSRISSVRSPLFECKALAIAWPPRELMPLPQRSSASSRRPGS